MTVADRVSALVTKGRSKEWPPRMAKFKCADCTGVTDDYMVHDSVWSLTDLPKKGALLCLTCLEARLGRPLCADDFTDAFINLPLLFGCRMGERSRPT